MGKVAEWYETRIFPSVMEWGTRAFRPSCRAVLAEAQGRVLEIGVGTGANLGFYGTTVTEVVGIEPAEALLATARERARALTDPAITLEAGDARALRYADASFDTVTALLVFCTIPEPERAAREVFRVLRPGGRLVFFEHVQASSSALSWCQARVNPLWRRLACGCEITRDTRTLFASVGFRMKDVHSWQHDGAVPLVAPVIAGVAIKP